MVAEFPADHPDRELALLNPQMEALVSLSQKKEIRLYYDQLPSFAGISKIPKFPVYVPSMAFRTAFRKRGINAKLQEPEIVVDPEFAKKRQEIRRRLGFPSGPLLWVDERLISGEYQDRLLKLLSAQWPNGICWVGARPRAKGKQIRFFSFSQADRSRLWYAADLLFTLQPPRISLVSVHRQVLAHGVPVASFEGSDHEEWVKHLFSGILLERKRWQGELAAYLKQIRDDRTLLPSLRENARRLIRRQR
jgi:hypothetical protein